MRIPVTTSDAPSAIGPYSQAIKAGGFLWCSGQLGLTPASGSFASQDTAVQAEQCLRNLDAICREAGTSLSKAVKCGIFLADLADFAAVNEVYARWFEAPFPARATVQVARLPKDAKVEIDAVVEL